MTGHGPHSSKKILCCSMYCLFCVILCTVCVQMCTVLLPPGGNPIAANKYITSYFVPYGVNIFDATLDSISRIRNLTSNYQWLCHKMYCSITSRGIQIRFVIIEVKQ